jgi:hypothetical protein
MTLREALEQLPNDELEAIMQDHIDWEESMSVPLNAQLRKFAIAHLSVDNTMQMDRVACEVFRVYALRAAGLR